jgi:molecular chaperone DnaK
MRTVGIDLGTTNTVVALDGTVVQHFVDGVAHGIVPSMVAFPPNGTTLLGAPARARRAIDPKNTISSAKRLMGQGWHGYVTNKFKQQYPFDLVERAGGPAFRTRTGTFGPEEIASKLISHAIAELFVSGSRTRCVVTVPAAFDERARTATREAAAHAGLLNVHLLAEPVAAAHAYLQRSEDKPRRMAVFDLGGGTFDFAVVDAAEGEAQVLGHGGDPYLGGDDLDGMLAEWVAQQVLERFGWDLRTDVEVMDRLVVQCEYAKVRLGLDTEANIELGQVDPAAPFGTQRISVTREVFEQLSRDFVARTFAVCDEVLRNASLTVRDIDAVFMSGGCTLLPMVREGVSRYFGKTPRSEINPLEVVAIGASLCNQDE